MDLNGSEISAEWSITEDIPCFVSKRGSDKTRLWRPRPLCCTALPPSQPSPSFAIQLLEKKQTLIVYYQLNLFLQYIDKTTAAVLSRCEIIALEERISKKQNVPLYSEQDPAKQISSQVFKVLTLFFFSKLLQFGWKMNVTEKQFNNATDALNNLQSCLEKVTVLIYQEQNIICNIQ